MTESDVWLMIDELKAIREQLEKLVEAVNDVAAELGDLKEKGINTYEQND